MSGIWRRRFSALNSDKTAQVTTLEGLISRDSSHLGGIGLDLMMARLAERAPARGIADIPRSWQLAFAELPSCDRVYSSHCRERTPRTHRARCLQTTHHDRAAAA